MPKSAKRSNFVGADDFTVGGATVPVGSPAVGGATGACVIMLEVADCVTDGR